MIEPPPTNNFATLDETIATAAETWSRKDRLQIIEGLRAQRDQWNTLQKQGSRKMAKSSAIPVAKPARKPKTMGLAAHLKGIKL